MKKLLLLLFVIASLTKQSQAQIITTVVGNGAGANSYTCCYGGDGGQATIAELNLPCGMTFDISGNLYIADRFNNRIRKVILSTGIISTIAGTGFGSGTLNVAYSGDGGQATSAEISTPTGLTFDAFGNLYIADASNNVIRKVNTSGIISTFVGNGTLGYSGDGGPATIAQLSNPIQLAFDSKGNLYFSDEANNHIRKVDTLGIINAFAGVGGSTWNYSGDGGQATAAELYGPVGIAFDAADNLYFADIGNNRIRKINTAGIISTFAGNGTQGYSGDGGPATSAELNNPGNVIFDSEGNLYITDENQRVRQVNTAGIISTIAGDGIQGFSGDGGQAINADLHDPGGLACDAIGNLYIADNLNNRVRKVTNVGQTGISQISGLNSQISIYPNPATNSVHISWAGNSQNANLVMTDMLGKCVHHQIATSSNCQINIADLEAGVYFITVTSGTNRATQKLIVR